MNTQRIANILRSGKADDNVTIQGWIRSKREQKSQTFLDVNDGSSLKGLQVVITPSFPNYEETIKKLNNGTSVAVSGKLVKSQGEGQMFDLKPSSIKIYGASEPELYPLQKKRIGFERLREKDLCHFRPRTNTLGAVFRVRNACANAIHQFFQERGFLWVHTPIITTNDCEGAGELFTVTSLELGNVPRLDNQEVDYSQDFFGTHTYLTVSGQLQAEIMTMAFQNVYTFGPTFRSENSNTSRHLAEFWMIEPEMAFCDLVKNQNVAEEFLKHIFRTVLEVCPNDMEFFNKNKYLGNSAVLEKARNIIDNEFERITYTKAIEILENSGRIFEYPVEWGLDLQSEHERYLTEEEFKKPVIVTDYPKEIKAFYMRLNDDTKTVAAMDVLAPGIGEIIGGSQREERFNILENQIIDKGLYPEDLSWYLDLRRYGTVPHSGFGLGFERLIQFMTGMKNIRDVIPFPRTPMKAYF